MKIAKIIISVLLILFIVAGTAVGISVLFLKAGVLKTNSLGNTINTIVQNYWYRSGTTIQPNTAGDSLKLTSPNGQHSLTIINDTNGATTFNSDVPGNTEIQLKDKVGTYRFMITNSDGSEVAHIDSLGNLVVHGSISSDSTCSCSGGIQ